MKNERVQEPEITLVTPKLEAGSCPPYGGGSPRPCPPDYPDGPCEPIRRICNPNCNPNCVPGVLPRPCDPTSGAPRPPRPPGPS